MSGLEQAIRNALDRADRSNPEIRTRIYQSARNALDAGLRKQEVSDATIIERQRLRLESTIEAIEEEERERLRREARLEKVFIESTPFTAEPEAEAEEEAAPAVAAPEMRSRPAEPAVEAPAVSVEPVDREVPADAAEDGSLSGLFVTRGDERPAGRGTADVLPVREERGQRRKQKVRHEEEDPAWAEPSTPEGRKVAPEKRAKRRRSGSLLVSLFVYAVLLGTVAAGVWWVYATGMLNAALHGTSDFDLIPKELQSEDFDPAKEPNRLDPLRGFSGDWMDIFKPGETDHVTAKSGATVTPVSDSDGAAVAITSTAPDQDGEVRIEVPAAILQELAGKTSTIALTVRSDSEQPSQIYVQCEFTTLGDCGRHRFTVSNERADELIQVQFDGKLGPSEPGHIVINSDLTGDGRAIRLYGIRVLPGS